MKKSMYFAAFSTGAMLAGTGVASAQEAPVSLHTVAVGESLSTIAEAKLGTADRWLEIFARNRTTLADPEVLAVGQVLDVPTPPAPVPAVVAAPEAPVPAEPSAPRPHTVAVGESLSSISQTELGASNRWVEIFALNHAALASPDVIAVGQVIDIPTAPVDVPAELLARLVPVAPPSPAAAAVGRSSATTQAFTGTGGAGGNLAAIRACESSGDYGAVSAGGQYRGAYQFDIPTWQSVGGSGDPASASPAEQDARASQLLSQRGSSPWPNCG